jgi:hypothetical protein
LRKPTRTLESPIIVKVAKEAKGVCRIMGCQTASAVEKENLITLPSDSRKDSIQHKQDAVQSRLPTPVTQTAQQTQKDPTFSKSQAEKATGIALKTSTTRTLILQQRICKEL